MEIKSVVKVLKALPGKVYQSVVFGKIHKTDSTSWMRSVD